MGWFVVELRSKGQRSPVWVGGAVTLQCHVRVVHMTFLYSVIVLFLGVTCEHYLYMQMYIGLCVWGGGGGQPSLRVNAVAGPAGVSDTCHVQPIKMSVCIMGAVQTYCYLVSRSQTAIFAQTPPSQKTVWELTPFFFLTEEVGTDDYSRFPYKAGRRR